MNIPDEAIEAAAKGIFGDPDGETWALQLPEVQERSREDARQAFKAAAKYLMEQAWEDGYHAHMSDGYDYQTGNPYKTI